MEKKDVKNFKERIRDKYEIPEGPPKLTAVEMAVMYAVKLRLDYITEEPAEPDVGFYLPPNRAKLAPTILEDVIANIGFDRAGVVRRKAILATMHAETFKRSKLDGGLISPNPNPCVGKWTMKGGGKIKISEMSDKHLVNAINLCERLTETYQSEFHEQNEYPNPPDYPEGFQHLYAEAIGRKLPGFSR